MSDDLEEVEVLVVEDNEEIANLICAFLSTFSISCDTTVDPEEALELINKHKYEVCVLDIMLNSEVSGVDLAVAMRNKLPAAKIYALTGHFDLFKDISPEVAGFDAAFYKPVDYKAFTDVIIQDLILYEED